jgi:putative aldouronate transport system permease protein
LYPLQLVLRNALTNLSQIINSAAGAQLAKGTQNIYGDSVRSALIVISSVPIIVVYPFIQKYFAKGILLGSVKG